MHADAVKVREAQTSLSVELGRTAVIGATKSIYWLAKQEIPHATNYVPLFNLAKRFGCEFVQHLFVGHTLVCWPYTSEHSVPPSSSN